MSKKEQILSGGLNALLGGGSTKEESASETIQPKRFENRGRPRKDEAQRQRDEAIYVRATNIYRRDQLAKIREISFRENITIKEFLEAALELAISKYERINGDVIPSEHKGDIKKLFK